MLSEPPCPKARRKGREGERRDRNSAYAASFLAADVCCVLRYHAELIAGIDGWRGKAGSRRVNFSALVGAFKKNAPKRWLADPGSGPPIAEEASKITIPVRPRRKYQRRPGNNRDLMSYKPNY